MTKFQSTSKKAILSAGLFSLCLLSTVPEAMAKSIDPQKPLTTVATVPTLKQTVTLDTDAKSEPRETDNYVHQEIEEKEVAYFSPYRWYRRLRRWFG